MVKKVTAADIKLALSRRYDDGWMFFTEVMQPTKWKCEAWIHDFPEDELITRSHWIMNEEEIPKSRIIDVYVLAISALKEATAIGLEIKVQRTDFQREIKSEKYRAWLPYCDKFYFVCVPGVAKPEEIPEECGLIEVSRYGRGYRRIVVVEAPRRSIERPPWHLLVRLVRKIHNEMWRLNYEIWDLKENLKRRIMINPDLLKQGTQILYVPNHAEGDLDHEDVEQGFVTLVGQRVARCRFWRKDGTGLRTRLNSESVAFENLFMFKHRNKKEVEDMLLVCGYELEEDPEA